MPQLPQDEWLPPLQECVTRINDTFSASFATIGCAGEVALHEADDYDQFAIHIRRDRCRTLCVARQMAHPSATQSPWLVCQCQLPLRE